MREIMVEMVGFVETPTHISKLMVEMSSVPRDSAVLDTGCGKGVFLKILKEYGYVNIYGIEIDDTLYEFCNSNYGNFFNTILGDYLSYEFNRKFELIIGNPPYAHFNQLSNSSKKMVKNLIKTSEGDIYYAFIIKSISLLKENGELIYIVPYHFFYNTHAEIVRKYLITNGKIEIIIDLDETPIFSNERPETIIFKFRRGKFDLRTEKIKLLRITRIKASPLEIYEKGAESLKKCESNELFEYKEFSHYTTSKPWSTFIFELPMFPCVSLKNIAKVGVSPVSGFDNAFILRNDENINFNSEELGIIKKFVKGKNCKRYIVNGYASYILIDDCIRNEDELKNKYPNIFRKMVKYKNKMEKRYLPKGKKWFHWQAMRNYEFLKNNIDKKRIYVPTLDRHPYNRFSLDENYLLPSGDVLFIQPYNEEDIYFLLGYLNSSFFRRYYLAKGGRRGGRISFTQRLLENIDIPLFSKEIKEKISFITLKIIDVLKYGNGDITKLEKTLNDVIYNALRENKFDNSIKSKDSNK